MTNYNFKYIIIGDSYVGKSSIMANFIHNEFIDTYEITLGVDFGIYNHKINNDNIKVQLWDTAGQEIYKSIIRSYYRSSNCCLLVFDITNKNSFENIKEWKTSVETYSNIKPLFILIGNKSDLEDKRVIKKEDALQFAIDNNMEYIETSAKFGLNIKNTIINSIEKIYNNINCDNLYDTHEKKNSVVKLKKNNTIGINNDKYKCCNII